MTTARRKSSDQPQALSPATSGGGPTVLRIALGGQLRRLRERNGITREAAGEALRASDAKISRLELGRVGFKERDISDLLTLYGVRDADEREAFLNLARQANSPGWWHRYNDLLPTWFETYLGLEQSATVIRSYQPQFVHGLLQTKDYARGVIELAHGHEQVDDIDRRVELRMQRQEILDRPGAPTLWAVLDEAALRRPVGGTETLRTQIEYLIEAADRPNVTIQLLPYHVGGHAAAGGPFTILRFAEPDLPDIVYLEQLTSALYLDKRPDVDRYLAVIDTLGVQAEPPDQTRKLLTAILGEI
jgi:transcriptional regulator with XRE-family HTH domain